MSFYGLVGQGPLVNAEAVGVGLLVYVGSVNRTLHRYDGTAWTTVTVDTMGAAESVLTVGCAATDPNTVYVLGQDASNVDKLHVSLDGGVSWVARALPALSSVGFLQDVKVGDPAEVYVSACCDDTSAMLWKSRDAGISWSKIVEGLVSGDADDLVGQSVGFLSLSPANIWVGGDELDTGTNANSTYGVHRYDREGGSHLQIPYDNRYLERPHLVARPDGNDRAWVYYSGPGPGGSETLLRASTSAVTDVSPTGPAVQGVYDVVDLGDAVASAIVLALVRLTGVGTTDWSIYRSTTGGGAWTSVAGPSGDYRRTTGPYHGVFAQHPTTPAEVYLATNTKVWRSTNSGSSWSDITPGGGATFIGVAAGYS